MFKRDNIKIMVIAFLVIFSLVGIVSGIFLYNYFKDNGTINYKEFKFSTDFELKNFESEEEFKEYLSFVENMGGYGYGGGVQRSSDLMETDGMAVPEAVGDSGSDAKVDRYSETNVQVKGIDEKDIVKTDGENIYFSGEFWGWGIRPMAMESEIDGLVIDPWNPDYDYKSELEVIKAFPPKEMKKLSSIEINGEILLKEDNLVVFDSDGIYTYDVSEPENPKESWDIVYEDRFSLVDARLLGDEIFVILNNYQPSCPIMPMSVGREIGCQDIYYSPASTDSNSMYVIYKVDVKTGEVKETISFLGSSMNTVIYMSLDNIFVTYSLEGDRFEIQTAFALENKDLFDSKFLESIEKLKGYDISPDAKLLEFEKILETYVRKMSYDEEMKFENEYWNRMEKFNKENIRDLNFTGILRVENDSLSVKAMSKVPGYVLNQFSLDEYDGFLRIATTVGERWSENSLNDLYVLNSKLEVVGSALDMGEGERIYSSRFIGDKGYIVTFREIDPFYVLDLSNPQKPEIKGELKIPGYSSYLHPLAENTILGVGMEDQSVKLSLFDVSDVRNPKEKDKYILKEYWSDILNTHKAFLIDPKHEIFFIPGSEGGYIFSYEGDNLELVKALKAYGVRRALFINDYLYMITDDKIVTFDQNGWEEVNEFKFKKSDFGEREEIEGKEDN